MVKVLIMICMDSMFKLELFYRIKVKFEEEI